MVRINYISPSFKTSSNLTGKIKPISPSSKTKDKNKDENNNYLYAFRKTLEFEEKGKHFDKRI